MSGEWRIKRRSNKTNMERSQVRAIAVRKRLREFCVSIGLRFADTIRAT
jgi:hypothetical protein